ncbi:hypothetical protein [Longispora fulva]|uniref:Uncharacterized protein n=1 Tax=Longispora fulva TaxID=619741 RepID=A0A8J7KMW8_9ACTN|nr:hypothetical protein [Longispora fulva]MBG6134502.1 hypothetical protein [Longispora fulva]
MQDELLSRAVIVYVWGNPAWQVPSSHPEAVRDVFGEQADQLLVRIETLLREVGTIQFDDDLAIYSRRIQEALRLSHPELSREAGVALAGKLTYAWR